MFGKPFLIAAALGISLAFAGATAANAQQSGTTPTKPHSAHIGHDVCKTHPTLPQCK